MHEVITLSVGHRPNHLATQYFNCQEELLSGQAGKLNDPSIFLQPCIDRISKTVSYAPRALFWDAKTGCGALGTYQYDQSSDYYYTDENIQDGQNEVIVTHPRIPKAGYQAALDSASGKLPKLSRETTKYWSDYAKLIYPPSSFNVLKDWYHDISHPNLPDYQRLDAKKFDNYEVGYQEFDENYLQDFFDGNLHTQLEQCDTLQGFNLITDMDSGWGGFSSSMLVELRNELPKASVFTWGFNQDDPLTAQTAAGSRMTKSNIPKLKNKIRSTVALADESDLMLPLYADPDLTNWEQAGLTCKLYDTVNATMSQVNLSQRVSMEGMTNGLTLSDTARKFVSSIEGLEQGKDSSFFARIRPSRKSKRGEHAFTSCRILRGLLSDQPIPDPKVTDLSTYAYCPSDTIPDQYRQEKEFAIKLSSTEICRDVFKDYEEVVSRYFNHDSDREELKDSLGSMSSNYEFGWYDDESSGDDDM